MTQQPPAKDQYEKLATLYQKALAEAEQSDNPAAYRERAKSAYDRAVAKVARETTPQAPTPQAAPSDVEEIRPPMGPAKAIGTVLATGFPGAPAAASAIGAAFEEREPNESFQQAYQRKMRGLGEAERQAKEELYPGVGTALQVGGAGLAMSRLPLVAARAAKDAPALAKTIAAGKRIAGAGVIGGAESASRQGMNNNDLSPAQSAAVAAGITGGLEVGFPLAGATLRAASRIPFVGEGLAQAARAIVKPAAEAVTQARRGVSDYIAPRFPQVAQAIEPTDVIKVQRTMEDKLPTYGQTVEQMRQKAGAAEESARGIESALKTAEESVAASAGRTAARGKELIVRAGERSEDVVRQLEQEAETRFGQLAATKGRGAAMREAIKSRLDRLGKQLYGTVQKVAPLPEPPRRLYQQIDKNPSLSSAFDYAINTKQQRLLAEQVEAAVAAGKPITERVKAPRQQTYLLGQARNPQTGEMVDVRRPVLDLETLDYMKRWVNDRVEAGLSGDATGITRSQATKLKKDINRITDDFLNAHGPEARKILVETRNTMSREFDKLELVQEGFNLSRFALDAPAKVREAAARDLTEQIAKVSALDPKVRKFFEVPARQSIANLIQSNDQSLGGIASALVGTTEARKRATLALGKDVVTELQKFLPDQIKGAAELAAAPIRRTGEKLVARGAAGGGLRTRRLAEEASALGQQLQRQSERATQLGALAETAQQGISALSDYTAGRGFAATLPETLGGVGKREVGGAMAGAIQDQLRGLSPQEAIAKLQAFSQNPAARAMFGNAIDQALEQLRPRASGIPSLRAALIGEAVGKM